MEILMHQTDDIFFTSFLLLLSFFIAKSNSFYVRNGCHLHSNVAPNSYVYMQPFSNTFIWLPEFVIPQSYWRRPAFLFYTQYLADMVWCREGTSSCYVVPPADAECSNIWKGNTVLFDRCNLIDVKSKCRLSQMRLKIMMA